MKVRIIFDNYENKYFVQYRKWWYVGWKYISFNFGKKKKRKPFISITTANMFVDAKLEIANQKRMKAISKNKYEIIDNREIDSITDLTHP